jgi:hypothetical protein
MKHTIDILGTSFDVEFDYRVTYGGARATGPTYSCGGISAEPMEYDVDNIYILNPEQPDQVLGINKWLRDLITVHLLESDAVYAAIEEEYHCG